MATTAQYGVAVYGDSAYGALLLNTAPGSYTLTGSNASFLYGRSTVAASGSYDLTGSSAAFINNQVIYAGTWSFNITGGNADLIKTSILNADAGSYVLTGKDAEFVESTQSTQTKGGFYPEVKKVKTKLKRSEKNDIEQAVRDAFDRLETKPDITPELVTESVIQSVITLPNFDLEYTALIIEQLLLESLQLQAIQQELDDEEALLMLL